MAILFQFGLEAIPIPSVVVDWSQVLHFRQTRGDNYSIDLITDDELAALMTITVPVAANVSALDLFEAEDVAQINRPQHFRGQFSDWFRHALEIVGSKNSMPWVETIVYSISDRAVPVMGRACSVEGPTGRLDHILWSFIDVSALKRAELEAVEARQAADAANVAKSAFLATMSHEIRTPLNGVLGMAQALESDTLSSTQRERVAVIRESGEALLAILNDVLDLSKIEAGKLELEEIEFDLTTLVRGAHTTFTALANKKGLSFCLTIDDDAEGRYLGDPTRIRQILYNLMSNALKFTEHGEIRLEVSRRSDTLKFEVVDTGIGIPDDRLPALFSKFTQVDSSNTRRFGGTGLGLSICRDLTHLMGGDIKAESKLNLGSRFTITLQLPRLGEAASGGAAKAEVPAPSLRHLPLRILVAEDNTVNQLVLKVLLDQIGVVPTVVENGLKALEAWQADSWDIILMDVQMPEMDGIAATRAIRRLEASSGRGRTPIIALSANVMSHQICEYMESGMDGHIGKPIDVRTLYAVIERYAASEAEGGSEAQTG